MRSVLSRFTSSQKIPHFRIQFPLRPAKVQKLISSLQQINRESPALFLSVNGLTEDAELCNSLRDAFRFASTSKRYGKSIRRVPLYSFLQDNINGLSYFVATAGHEIHANPFCKIGDLTAPSKSYLNIQTLLKKLGVEFEKIGNKANNLWESNLEPSQTQKITTTKWLNVISRRLTESILRQRGLDCSAIQAIGSRLIHPKKALELKLVNSVSSLEQFRSINFPNNSLNQKDFRPNSQKLKFNQRQLQILTQINSWLDLPRVVLATMDDPLVEAAKKLGEIASGRLTDEHEIEVLDTLAGRILQKFKDSKIQKLI